MAQSLTVSPATVAKGQNYTVTWSSTYLSNCSLSSSPSTFTSSAASGSQSVTAGAAATYNFTCTGTYDGLTYTKTASVAVGTPTVSMSVSPTSVPINTNYTLTWSASNVASCSATGPGWSGSTSLSGSQVFSKSSGGTYGVRLRRNYFSMRGANTTPGSAKMASAKEFRENANDCLVWARTVTNEHERAIFLDMARNWREAASKAERSEITYKLRAGQLEQISAGTDPWRASAELARRNRRLSARVP